MRWLAELFSFCLCPLYGWSNFYNTVFSARQLRINIGKYVGIGISFPLLSGLERLTHQRKQKLNLYRLKNEEELEKQQLYTDIEQTLLPYMPV